MIKLFSFVLFLLLIGCSTKDENYRFVHVSEETSQIHFENTITENEEINIIDFQYCYNGGGVGIGDFNNDGLQDIVFTGNQVSSKIYLNSGDLAFIDISEKAQFYTNSWVTGVCVVDINADGLDDIYLSVGGNTCNNDCPNLLFVNQGVDENGIPNFKENAKAYGLNDANYAQQAVFFDYDLDGDLDVYIVHNGNTTHDKNTPMPKRYLQAHLSDYLLKNNRIEGVDHPVFTNVSDSLNITGKGFGLGVGIHDFNGDNAPDVYVSNDFITDDFLYINKAYFKNENPAFIEASKEFLSHETYNAMGVDIADVNNDLIPDILVLDMLPKLYKRQKLMLGSMNYDKYLLAQKNEYTSQYMHNTLQFGNGFLNDKPLKASELGFQKGLASTDWSWSPLMVDFDNDGDKDIYITNGYVKDITDLDFINYSNQNSIFGTPDAKSKRLKKSVKSLKSIHLPNFMYEQIDNENFNDVSTNWMQEKASFSNGAAYADLDNDGDLDLIVNNINEKAFLLENKTSEKNNTNYLRIALKGELQNSKAIGAKITLYHNHTAQQQYQSVVRGYLSSVEPIIHFGVQDTLIDSLCVQWPNGKSTWKYAISANQLITLDQSKGLDRKEPVANTRYLLKEKNNIINYTQDDEVVNEYSYQHLLMRQYTAQSSCISAADINGDVGDEIFIGGSKGKSGSIWFQDANGVYEPKQFLDADFDDTQAEFMDVDSDGDLDLYVASGGNRFSKNEKNYQDRVYINDGNGFFTESKETLPKCLQSTSSIAKADFDKDGDIDLFVGSRMTPKEYPRLPESSFLVNTNGVYNKKFHALVSKLGMVTSAIWADVDNDSWLDLVVVGEFMEITIFKNNKGNLKPMVTQWVNEQNKEINTSGWWNTIAASDFDKDGDIDFIIGNEGTNNFLQPTQTKPIYVYKKDFDQNGSLDPILAKFFPNENSENLLPVHTRDDIMKQLPVLKNTFTSYESFANASFKELLNIKDLSAKTLKANVFKSCYAVNLGNGKFKLISLPKKCQVAPINALLIDDFDADKELDVLMVGNNTSAETHYGNQDALTGILLKSENHFFKVIESKTSGFYVPEQANHFIKVRDKNGEEMYIVTQYNKEAKVFVRNKNL